MPEPIEPLRRALSDRYELIEEIGRGGMAVVYVARDLRHDRDVAVKILDPGLATSEFVDRFHREIHVAASLTHPHIVPIHDSGEAAGILYYVMPLVPGETLAERLERQGRLPIADVMRTGLDVAAALDYSHAHGVVHRDIKPANIFVSDGEALVSDFGVAVVLDHAAEDERLTTTGISIGTPRYMSPEQLTDPDRVDWRCDAFSLGVVLFECISGRLPFGRTKKGGHPLGWIPREPGALGDDCPRALEQIVLRYLALEPDDRIPFDGRLGDDMRAVARALAQQEQDVAGRGYRRGLVTAAALGAAIVLAVAILDGPLPPLRGIARYEPLVTAATREREGRYNAERDEISFLSDRDGRVNVWAVPADGGRERQITDEGAEIVSHTWSPTGMWLAYIVRSRNGYFLRITDADGVLQSSERLPDVRFDPSVVGWLATRVYMLLDGALWAFHVESRIVRQVTVPEAPQIRYADVHPNEGRIVYGAAGAIYLADIDGTNADVLVEGRGHTSPCWTGANGSEIAFVSNEGGQVDVWHVRISDGERKPVTVGAGTTSGVTCAPDGNTLFVDRNDRRADLWLWSPEAGETRLTADSRADLAASVANNGRVVFQRASRPLDVGMSSFFDAEIVVGTLDGKQLTDTRVISDAGAGPEISPNGRWVSFIRYPSEAGSTLSELWVVPDSGSGWRLTRRYRTPIFRTAPPIEFESENQVWAPSGETLYFVELLEDERTRISRADLTGSGPLTESLIEFDADDQPMDLSVSPDGALLSYVVHSEVAGVDELRVLDTRTRREQPVYGEETANRLYNVGWVGADGPLIAAQSFLQADREVPLRIDLDGTATALPALPGGYAGQARIRRSPPTLLMPADEGEALSVRSLRLENADGWTRVVGGALYSAVEAVRPGGLIYVRHEENSDVWRVVFEAPEEG